MPAVAGLPGVFAKLRRRGDRTAFPFASGHSPGASGPCPPSGPAQQLNSSQTQCAGGLQTPAGGEAVWEGQPGAPRWLCSGACCQAGSAERIRCGRLLRGPRGARHDRRQRPVPLPEEAAGAQSCAGWFVLPAPSWPLQRLARVSVAQEGAPLWSQHPGECFVLCSWA